MDLLRRLLLGLTLSIAVLCAEGGAAGAEGRMTREYDLKAIFLFQFAHFVNWPASTFPDTLTPITIGVLGNNPFGAGLDEVVAGESVGAPQSGRRSFPARAPGRPWHRLFHCASRAWRPGRTPARPSGRRRRRIPASNA